MRTANWNWRRLLRDWKTRLLCLVFFIFLATYSFLYRQQNLPLPLDEMRSRYEVTQQLFNIIPESHFQNETGREVSDLLARQQRLYGMQRYILSEQEGNTVKNLEKVVANYVDNGLEIVENQNRLWEMDDFKSYRILTHTLPDKEEIQKEASFLSYLKKQNLDIEWNPFSASHILQQQLELVAGVFLFLFVALLGADRFTQDQTKNWSVTQGVPIPWKDQWRERSKHLWLLMWGTIFGGIAVSYMSSLIRETSGSLQYPVSIYIGKSYFQIAMYQYGILLMGSAMVFSFLLILLTIGLSWMIRNIYLTLTIVVSLYFVPYIWTLVQPFSSFQPSLYVHLPELFKGELMEQTRLTGLVFWKLPVMWLLFWGILEWSFSHIFNLIPTQTIGLKRRETA